MVQDGAKFWSIHDTFCSRSHAQKLACWPSTRKLQTKRSHLQPPLRHAGALADFTNTFRALVVPMPSEKLVEESAVDSDLVVEVQVCYTPHKIHTR
jgi:hypothetical protein